MPLEDKEETVIGCKGKFSSHFRNLYYLNIFVAAVIDVKYKPIDIVANCEILS